MKSNLQSITRNKQYESSQGLSSKSRPNSAKAQKTSNTQNKSKMSGASSKASSTHQQKKKLQKSMLQALGQDESDILRYTDQNISGQASSYRDAEIPTRQRKAESEISVKSSKSGRSGKSGSVSSKKKTKVRNRRASRSQSTESKYDKLVNKNQELKFLLKEQFKVNNDLIEQVEESKQKIEDLQLKNKQLKSQTKELESRLNFANESLKDKNQAHTQVKDEIKQFRNVAHKYELLKQDNDNLTKQYQIMSQMNEQLKLQVEQFEMELNHQKQIRALSPRDPRESYQGQPHFYQPSGSVDQMYMKELLTQNQMQKTQLEQQNQSIAELEHQIAIINQNLQIQIEDYEGQLNALRDQLKETTLKAGLMENQLKTQRFSSDTLYDQLNNDKDQMQRLQEQVKIDTFKLENRERELKESKARELVLSRKVLDLESQLRLFNQYQPAEQDQIKFSPNQNLTGSGRLNQQLLRSQTGLNSIKKQMGMEQEETTSRQLLELQQENQALKQQIEEMQNSSKVPQSARRISLQEKVNGSSQGYERIKTDNESFRQTPIEGVETHTLKRNLEERSQQIQRYQKEIYQLNCTVERLKQKQSELKLENKKLQQLHEDKENKEHMNERRNLSASMKDDYLRQELLKKQRFLADMQQMIRQHKQNIE